MILIILEGFTVPCGRGDTESGYLFRLIMYLIPVIITPAIIVSTMIIMYRTVRKIERKMLSYGAGVLRLPAHQRPAQEVVNDPTKMVLEEGEFAQVLLYLSMY